MVFAITACGFKPRCALEANDAGEERLGKILRIIDTCALGIHDLSRKGSDAQSGMSRFNMPFEMGLFLGAAHYDTKKKALVIEAEKFDYQKFISDISGRDISHHENDPSKLISIVRNWLNGYRKGKHPLPGPQYLWDHYNQFQSELPSILKKMQLTSEDIGPYHFLDYSFLVATWIESKADIQNS